MPRRFIATSPSPNPSAKVMRSTIFYARTPSHTTVPFPAGTHGFLYHGSKTSVSRADSTDADHDTKHVGQVRFRITSSSDPTTFANGKDLQLPTGLPWLTYIQGRRRRTASQGCLWELLVRDGYIFETDASNYHDRKRTRRGTTFHRFGQPFLYNFSHHMVGWTVVSESQGGKRVRVNARNPLRPCRRDGIPVVYTGTALCCLEKVGKGTERIVAIRILKIVDPVKQVLADVPLMRNWLPDRPVEGELLPSSKPGRKWLYNVDKRCGGVAQSLALLFENERLRADNLDSAP